VPDVGIVLVEPQEAGNIGAAARAMANMGLSRLVLVNPVDHMAPIARRMALGGRNILAGAQVHRSLKEAVAEFDLVIGTTRREGSVRQGRVTPRAAAAEIASSTPLKKAAVVFGRERCGLTNNEVDLCHRLLTIPTAPGDGSLNLSQAVVIVAYEILLASDTGATKSLEPVQRATASHGEMEQMYAHMEEVLLRTGYLHDSNPERMMRSFRRILGRAQLDRREVQVLRGVFHQLQWYGAARAKGSKTG
jgi:TrmH family RNA methyltransferase